MAAPPASELRIIRIVHSLLVLLVCGRAPLAAQTISAFVGASLPVTTKSELTTSATLGLSNRMQSEESGHGFVAGLAVAVPVADRIELGVEGSRQSTGKTRVSIRTEEGATSRYSDPGGTLWTARLGVAYRFQTTVPVLLSAGPALVVFDPVDLNEFVEREAYTSWGGHVGVSLRLQVNDMIAFRVGVDDLIVAWNDAVHEERLEDDYEESTGNSTIVNIDSDLTHILAARFGLAWTF